MTGHPVGGAGGLEAGIHLHGHAQPDRTTDHEPANVDPVCRLNTCPNKPQKAKIDYALSTLSGLGHERLRWSSSAGARSSPYPPHPLF